MSPEPRGLARALVTVAFVGIAGAQFASGCGGGDDDATSSGGEGDPVDAGPAVTPPEPLDAGVDLGLPLPPEAPAPRDAGIGIPDAGPSPWGASRAERCAPPARPTLTAGAQAAFDEAVAAASRGELATARSRFERALDEDRRAFRAAYNLGVLADRMGRESEALEFYRQALRIVPSYEAAAEGMVLLMLRRGRTQDALEFIRPLTTQFPWNDQLHATHARVLGALNRWDDAFREARLGLQCDERSVAALTALAFAAHGQRNLEMASWILERIASVEATDSAGSRYAESHYLRGLIARGRPGEVEIAVREFERAVQLKDDYVDARMALGQLLLATGDYAGALRHLEIAARAAPWSWAARLAYADALRSSAQYDEARREIERAREISPNQPELHLSLGLVFLEQANCLRTSDLSALGPCTRALNELGQYRSGMGSRLPADDRTAETIQTLTRIVSRMNAAREAAEQERAAADGGVVQE